MTRLVSVDQAAERLGTTPKHVRRLITERRIAYTRVGRYIRIDVADLEAFVAAGRVESVTYRRALSLR